MCEPHFFCTDCRCLWYIISITNDLDEKSYQRHRKLNTPIYERVFYHFSQSSIRRNIESFFNYSMLNCFNAFIIELKLKSSVRISLTLYRSVL